MLRVCLHLTQIHHTRVHRIINTSWLHHQLGYPWVVDTFFLQSPLASAYAEEGVLLLLRLFLTHHWPFEQHAWHRRGLFLSLPRSVVATLIQHYTALDLPVVQLAFQRPSLIEEFPVFLSECLGELGFLLKLSPIVFNLHAIPAGPGLKLLEDIIVVGYASL